MWASPEKKILRMLITGWDAVFRLDNESHMPLQSWFYIMASSKPLLLKVISGICPSYSGCCNRNKALLYPWQSRSKFF